MTQLYLSSGQNDTLCVFIADQIYQEISPPCPIDKAKVASSLIQIVKELEKENNGIVYKILDKIKTIASNVRDRVSSVARSAWNGVTTVATSVWETFKAFFEFS
ncbi:uncharacterized protein LOC131940025 [Physella acuta]|uniref:uncharacterized protein LOC131940025 n=1 Tax=Physella acuta TaxID=109671 RepID=UPI0027DC476D|nr:uncharacterized protein LOC131940025 [Physella acuta]